MDKQGNRLKKCELCGTLMSDLLNNPVCAQCMDHDAELFERAKKHLDYGEQVTVEELSSRSGINSKHIQRWVRTGRLSLSAG